MRFLRVLLLLTPFLASSTLRAQTPNAPAGSSAGEALFQTHCSSCHRPGSNAGAPLPATLRQMPARQILEALETGKMRAMASALTTADREAISNALGLPSSERAIPASARCASQPPLRKTPSTFSDWGGGLDNTRFQPARAAGLTAASLPNLKLKWAFGFPNVTTTFSQPTVLGGRLFVGSADGTVYSLNARSGCIHWMFSASEGVRTAVILSDDGQTAYFGDLHAVVYAVNAQSGALLWKTHVDEHPFAVVTGTPKLSGGRLYVPVSGGDEPVSASNAAFECCTFRGSLVALDARTGKQVWKTFLIPEPAAVTGKNSVGANTWGPSGVSLWSSPTIDLKAHAIYVGTGINFTQPATPSSDSITALDLASGRILWSRQFTQGDAYNFGCRTPDHANCPKDPGNDFDFGNSPMLRTLPGGRRVLIASQKSGLVTALDPDAQGKTLWETKIAEGGGQGGILWGGASDSSNAYFGISDWDPGKPEAGGGVAALSLASGKVLWKTAAPKPTCIATPGCSAAQPAPVFAIPGAILVGSMDGHLRAFATSTGKTLWDFDTARDFTTVDGIQAHGGSIDGAGPTVAGGMVFTSSGYARIPSMPGNVLLAFGK